MIKKCALVPLPVILGIFLLGIFLSAGLDAVTLPAKAADIETTAKQAYMIDADTGTVLLNKNGAVPVPPSSMSKMMTVYMAFDKIKQGSLSLKDTFLVSETAWRKGGSKMFVEVGKRIPVGDLLRGIIVQSGNDASIVIAEGLAGNEDAFAELANQKAKEMGLNDSHFVNASGWPAEGHVMSARDLATLSLRTIKNFPELYKIYAEKSFKWHGIRQPNRNPLLRMAIGADGLKTGHTEAAGFGLAASAVRKDRRLILVLNGMGSMRERSQESARLMDWGFREFNNYTLFRKGDTVEAAAVWLGKEASVPLVIDHDLTITLPRRARRNAKITVAYTSPIAAPIAQGKELAVLTIAVPDTPPIKIPLKAGKTVEQLRFMGRISTAISYLLWGSQKSAAKTK
ncbi:MAG: D-alanyl-D-alanine carboxypeptidase (penicillin-binding protein 5/6) [Alphaproteobacteria bacterium]|jgi:D-alanyl-D-alanine carboxypeptidase (penicillin-binding protein 5/6)